MKPFLPLVIGVLLWTACNGCPASAPESADPPAAKPAEPTPEPQTLTAESVVVRTQLPPWELRLKDLDADLDRQFAKYGGAKNLPPAELFKQRIQLRNVTLLRRLEEEAAVRDGIVATDESLDRRLREVAELNGAADLESFLVEAARQGVSRDDLIHDLRRQYRLETWFAEKLPQEDPPEEEVRAYYDQRVGQTRTAREILVAVSHMSPPRTVEIARQTAEEIYREVTQPDADFAAIAKARSESESAWEGGKIGPFEAGRMEMAMENVLWSLKPGEISQPFRCADGFRILQLEDIGTIEGPPYDEARDAIAKYMRIYIRQQRLMELERNLMQKAGVTYPLLLEDFAPKTP